MKCTVNHLLACLKKVFISRHLKTFNFNFTQIKKFAFDCSAVAATYADIILKILWKKKKISVYGNWIWYVAYFKEVIDATYFINYYFKQKI